MAEVPMDELARQLRETDLHIMGNVTWEMEKRLRTEDLNNALESTGMPEAWKQPIAELVATWGDPHFNT